MYCTLCTVCIGKLRSEAPLQDSNLIEPNIHGQIFFVCLGSMLVRYILEISKYKIILRGVRAVFYYDLLWPLKG